MNDARRQFIIDLVCKVKYIGPSRLTFMQIQKYVLEQNVTNFFVFPFHKFICPFLVRMSGTWEIFKLHFPSFFLSLQENIDIIINTATPWKFVILVPVEQIINWGPLHLTKCSIHSSLDDQTSISGQKCVRAFISECVTVFKCFWAKEGVGWTSPLSLWDAPFY